MSFLYYLKLFHLSCAALSFSGFLLRAVWHLCNSAMIKRPWVRVVPHVVDSALFLSGLTMALYYPAGALLGWLPYKLIALLCYIGFGLLAFRFLHKWWQKAGALLLAVASFAYIVMVALSKSPIL